ncbi:MAG TPA: RdgB/HAM1 family non-canonical purine NTP pyrophosphatase [Gammaproteobacteria bacterium]|nr:RdgB/HAM1 family non-canonical purine NTP pyrophosphatase [Gammaproteobacteria bacterium]
MKQIVLASNNSAKAEEVRSLLAKLPLEILNQSDFRISAAEETGLTFVENAIIKARHVAVHSGLASIADDSGLEVDALDGAPGVFSARYAGAGATDQANNAKLLTALQAVPNADRGARFHCVVVYLRHAWDPTPLICAGAWQGRILTAPRGDNGFGYDPLFYVPSHRCTSAEVSPAVKNRISHRAQALRRLARQLSRMPTLFL